MHRMVYDDSRNNRLSKKWKIVRSEEDRGNPGQEQTNSGA